MIRDAIIPDIPALIEMGYEFHEFSRLEEHGLGVDAESLARFMVFLIENANGILLVAEEEGRLLGAIAGLVAPWWADQKTLTVTEQWWWVAREARGRSIHRQLLDGLEERARRRGATHCFMVALEAGRREALKRLYGRLGFRPLEIHFIKPITSGN